MKIRILGCGPSYGMPSLSRGYGQCNPNNPKNTRTRTAMLLQTEHGNICFDTGPEIRLQLLSAGSPKISALIYTHAHYDHMGGAEDLHKIMDINQPKMPVYISQDDHQELKHIFYFAFPPFVKESFFDVHVINPYEPFDVNGLQIIPIKQYHGSKISFGYRIGDFAYSTDVKNMDEKGFEILKGIKTWILGVTTLSLNDKHINLDEALSWIDKIKPERVFLTHMGTKMDYDELCRILPPHIRPVYDGMEIEV